MPWCARIKSMWLVQQNLELRLPCREHREANDGETEVWRVCQRSSIATDGECTILDPRSDLGAVQVYLDEHEVLTNLGLSAQSSRNPDSPDNLRPIELACLFVLPCQRVPNEICHTPNFFRNSSALLYGNWISALSLQLLPRDFLF